MVELLLDHGANVHAMNKHGPTLLSEAISNGHDDDVVSTPIQPGADTNAKLAGGHKNVLTGTVLNGDLEIERLLLLRGAEDVKDRNGMTALSHARRRGDKRMKRLLIGHGADIPPEIDHDTDALGIAEKKPSTLKRLTTSLSL